MTLAQLLQTLRPSERDAVHAVYVERLSLAGAAAQLSVDGATLAAALSSAFTKVARWVETSEDEPAPPVVVGPWADSADSGATWVGVGAPPSAVG